MERISIQETATVAPATLMHVALLLNKKKNKRERERHERTGEGGAKHPAFVVWAIKDG